MKLAPPKNKRKLQVPRSCNNCGFKYKKPEEDKYGFMQNTYCRRDDSILDDEDWLTVCDGWKKETP